MVDSMGVTAFGPGDFLGPGLVFVSSFSPFLPGRPVQKNL